MNSIYKVALLVVLSLLALSVVSADGPPQQNDPVSTITVGYFGTLPASLNPISCDEPLCEQLIGLLFPKLLGVNPATGIIEAGVPGSLVTGWETSEDGTVYTFTLRDDWNWSDGTPITSNDVVYAWNAMTSEEIYAPLSYYSEYISSVEASDDHTLIITFNTPDCSALQYVSGLPVIPSHLFSSDYAALETSDYNLNPGVTAGVFKFGEIGNDDGEYLRLRANQEYPDSLGGFVALDEVIYKQALDQRDLVRRFLAGEFDVIVNPALNSYESIRAQEGDVQIFEYPGNTWNYFAFNLADPDNPQPAFDNRGRSIPQGNHPIFGDRRVRQAIALAINVDDIITASVLGEGTRMTSSIIPNSWAYDHDLAPIPYDPEQAASLLEEAGWIDEDKDGIREAHDAMYAPNNLLLEFTIEHNVGGVSRDAIADQIQAHLSEIGVKVNIERLDFVTLLDQVYAQTFDAIVLGWRDPFPHDPDQTFFFLPESDTFDSGANFMSYNNPDVTDLMTQARTLPGCDPEARTEIYHEIQAILQEDLPYVWLYAQNDLVAAQGNIGNFAPYPNQPFWNIADWFVQ